MYSDKVKLNEKPNRTKIRHGDVIIRSEYDDGVLRSNNRANNRLNNQMELIDKAQRVIMKDLGMETQILRNKFGTTPTSPRLQKYSPMNHVGTFNVNSKSPFTVRYKKDSNDSPREKRNSSFLQSISNRNQRNITSEAKTGQRKSEVRVGRVRPIVANKDNVFDIEAKSETPRLSFIDKKIDTSRSELSRHERRNESYLQSITPRNDRKTDSVLSESQRANQISATTSGRRSWIHHPITDRQTSATSRLSFIEILQKAEEAKSKGLTIEEHVARPKTPELLSDYSSDESEKEQRRKPLHFGATPISTYISQHI